MKEIKITIKEENGRVKTEMSDGVEINHTPIEAGVYAYITDVIRRGIDAMYDGAEMMSKNPQPCQTCETIVVGVCPDCGNEIGRIM